MTKKLLSMALATCLFSTWAFADDGVTYTNIVPTPGDSPLYYSIGGGDIAPEMPATSAATADINLPGLAGLGYSCGSFNPRATFANFFNGAKATFNTMFNNIVNSAKGALLEAPAYVLSKADPALYQVVQNGFAGAQKQFGLSVKSCQQMQNDIDHGRNPYQNMFKSSMSGDWSNYAAGASASSDTSLMRMTYQQAEDGDINDAKQGVNKNPGINGVAWTHGPSFNGNAHQAGGKPPHGPKEYPIKLTYDTVLAGVNALLSGGEQSASVNYYNKGSIPKTFYLSKIWPSRDAVATWAVSVLGEKTITTYKNGPKSAQPGMGLLPKVTDRYKTIMKTLSKLVSSNGIIKLSDLKAISTERLFISPDVIQGLRNDPPMRQSIEVSALAQGLAAAYVVDQGQRLIQILQTARQVPAIAINTTAQKQITQYINTLNEQIQQIVTNRQNNKILVTSLVQNMTAARQQYVAQGNLYRPGVTQTIIPRNGAVQEKEEQPA